MIFESDSCGDNKLFKGMLEMSDANHHVGWHSEPFALCSMDGLLFAYRAGPRIQARCYSEATG